ncbi:MAG: flippase-like domain-containing protein [Dehalococcoidia bacterium]|nr:flippase-like domain-containing protein [Dehalococcoidia bacterium]
MRRFALGMVITVASLALLARVINWDSTRSALSSADPWLIAAAVTCLVLSLAAKALRWRLLLPDEAGVTRGRLYRILHISFLLNNVLPARLGDVARVAMTSRQPGIRVGHALSSLLTERVTDMVTLLACFVAISPFLPLPAQYKDDLRVAWIVLAALVVTGIAAVILRRQLARLAGGVPIPAQLQHARVVEEAQSFRDGLRQLFSLHHALPILGWSSAAWIGAFAINFLLMRALNIDAPVTVAVLLTCTTNLAMLIPSSPGYVGVFHVAATVSLLPFDVGAPAAFSFAILAHLVNVIPVSLIGAAFLFAGRDSLPVNLRQLRQARAVPALPAPIDVTPDNR